MGKKKANKVNGETKGIQLQLIFERKLYLAIEAAAAVDNKRMNLVSRKEKIHQYKAIPMLVEDGLAFRRHEVYVPSDKRTEFMDDKEFAVLYDRADKALKTFHAYQNEMLAVSV